MKTWKLIMVAVGTSIGLFLAGGYWALAPFIYWPFSILGEHDEVALIKELFPFHLVDPKWIHAPKDDLITTWQFTEFKVRGAVILLTWVAGLVVFLVWLRHRHAANTALEQLR
jgi:hypothetical protein